MLEGRRKRGLYGNMYDQEDGPCDREGVYERKGNGGNLLFTSTILVSKFKP